MTIQVLNTLKLLLALLSFDNAPIEMMDHPVVLTHMLSIAVAIEDAPEKYQDRLISLAYNESRFGYRFIFNGKPVKSGAGACGIYQQLPRFAEGGKTTCKKLQDVDHATKQAVAYLKFIERKYKPRNTKQFDSVMCHYFSGNNCDRSAHAYARSHRKIRQRATRLVATR
jgi:hypothetical protein